MKTEPSAWIVTIRPAGTSIPVSANVEFPGTIRTEPFSLDSGAVNWPRAVDPATTATSTEQHSVSSRKRRRGIVFHPGGSSAQSQAPAD